MGEDTILQLLLEHSVIQRFDAGSLIRIWTPDTGIYYILEGNVHIIRLLKNGSRSIIHILGRDMLFFENRYFHHGTRTTAAYAVSPTKTAYLSPKNVEYLLATSLDFCHILIRNMSKKGLNSGKNSVDSCHLCAETRMLAVLYELACAQDGCRSSSVRITQATLADIVGKHPVNTNITLKRLEQAGFVRLKRGAIELDLERMEAALSSQES